MPVCCLERGPYDTEVVIIKNAAMEWCMNSYEHAVASICLSGVLGYPSEGLGMSADLTCHLNLTLSVSDIMIERVKCTVSVG